MAGRAVAFCLLATVMAAATFSPLAADCDSSPSSSLNEPLPVREQFSLTSTFLGLQPRSAETLQAGCTEIGDQLSAANTFAKSAPLAHRILLGAAADEPAAQKVRDAATGPVFFVNNELHRSTLELRHGLSDSLDVEATLSVDEIGGGFGDALIEGAHSMFHLGTSIRRDFPRNEQLTYIRTSGSETELEQTSLTSSDLTLGATRKILGDDRDAVSIRTVVKVPLEHSAYGESTDAGAELFGTRRLGAVVFSGSAALLRFGSNRELGTTRQTTFDWSGNATVRVTDRSAITFQLISSRSPLASLGFEEFRRPAYQVTVGERYLLGRVSLNVALIENLETQQNSADAGLQVGVSTRFSRW